MDGHLLRFNKNVTYGFIDLETFNLCLHFKQNRPWQVGLLEVKGEEIINSFDLMVKWPDAPHLKIGREAAIVTRFNQEKFNQLAKDPKPVFDIFWPVLEKGRLYRNAQWSKI
jgi:hypothetical protein